MKEAASTQAELRKALADVEDNSRVQHGMELRVAGVESELKAVKDELAKERATASQRLKELDAANLLRRELEAKLRKAESEKSAVADELEQSTKLGTKRTSEIQELAEVRRAEHERDVASLMAKQQLLDKAQGSIEEAAEEIGIPRCGT